MGQATYSIAQVNLKSRWRCSQSSNGTWVAGTPSTVDITRTVVIDCIPAGATNVSGYLTYTSGKPGGGADISAVNGIPFPTGQTNATLPLSNIANGNYALTFVYKSRGAVYHDTNEHYGEYILSNLSLTVSWTEPQSEWVIPGTVEIGSALPVTITNMTSGRTHAWQLVFGAYSSHWVTMAEGVTTSSLVIPLDWALMIPNSSSGTGQVVFQTRDAWGNVLHTAAKSLTIVIPSGGENSDAMNPDIGVVNLAVNNGFNGLCLQGISSITASLSSASGKYGASIVAITISGGSYSGGSPMTTGIIQTPGHHVFTATVTDSRGRSSSASAGITATAYNPPTFTDAAAYRTNADYIIEPQGEYMSGNIWFTWSQIAGTALKLYVAVKPEGQGWTALISDATPYDGAQMNFGGGFSVETTYAIRYTLTDGIASAEREIAIPRGYVFGFFDKDSKRMSFGSYPATAANGLTISPDWTFHTHGHEIVDLIRHTQHDSLYHGDQLAMFVFHDDVSGHGFQAGSPGTGTEFNLNRMGPDQPVTLWANGMHYQGGQGGVIYTELNPPSGLLYYPVGSIYISTVLVSPASYWGGEWERIPPDHFLLSTYDGLSGTTGGTFWYNLVANIGTINGDIRTLGYNVSGPSAYQQNHPLTDVTGDGAQDNGFAITASNKDFVGWNHSTVVSEINTNSATTSIVPPYYSVYMWRRVA